MIDPKFPRQFIACASIVAVILYGGLAILYQGINMEVFKYVFGALNVYPAAFFIVRQVEKRKE